MFPKVKKIKCGCGQINEIPAGNSNLSLVCLNCGKHISQPKVEESLKGKRLADFPEALARFNRKKNDVAFPENISANDWHHHYVWNCPKCLYEYKDRVRNQVKGSGCPRCKSIVVLFPEIAAEYHHELNVLPPEMILPNSSMIVWWKCELVFDCPAWQASVKKRVKGGGKCPGCFPFGKRRIKKKILIEQTA